MLTLKLIKLLPLDNSIIQLCEIKLTLQEILNNKSRLVEVVKEELIEIKDNFGDERRTEIIERRLTIDDADLIPEEERVFTISNNGLSLTSASCFGNPILVESPAASITPAFILCTT